MTLHRASLKRSSSVSKTARDQLAKDDFLLRAPIIELFEHLMRVGDGRIAVIEVKYGLPFRLIVEQRASGDVR